MDFIVKLLFLGGKYISQAAGRTILEIYNRSVKLGRHMSVQYEKTSEIIKPYDNMLELLNERVKENSDDDVHLAYINDELKKQLEDHLKRVPKIKSGEINELASDNSISSQSSWRDNDSTLTLAEDVHEDTFTAGENGLVSKDFEYDKMYTDLYKDLSNVIVKNTSVDCPIDHIAMSTKHNIAFKTSQRSEVQESYNYLASHGTSIIDHKFAASSGDEKATSSENLKSNSREFMEPISQPFHFEYFNRYRKSCRCNPLSSLYNADPSYMKYLVDRLPSDSYYKAKAIGNNGVDATVMPTTKEQNRCNYANVDEIIQMNNKEIIKGLVEEIENRMVLLKKNNEHFKTFEKKLHDRIVKSKVQQISKDVKLKSSILSQNTIHYNKFENKLEKKLKGVVNNLVTHRTLSSGNVGSSKHDLDEGIREIIDLLKVNEKEFQKLEQKVTQRLIRNGLNNDNLANLKERKSFMQKRCLSNYDEADRKERAKILEINKRVFEKFEKDMRSIVILEKNKPMDKDDKLISERLAKYHVKVHNDGTFNEVLNMERLQFNDFPFTKLKTKTTKRKEKKTFRHCPSMENTMEDIRERANIIQANAKAFELFESKMNNLTQTNLPKFLTSNTFNGNNRDSDKKSKGAKIANEFDSTQIINTLKEVLDNSTIFKAPKSNSRINRDIKAINEVNFDLTSNLGKIEKVLSGKEVQTQRGIGVMHEKPKEIRQICEGKKDEPLSRIPKKFECSEKNVDGKKDQKLEGNSKKHNKKPTDPQFKPDIKNDDENDESFLVTTQRLDEMTAQYRKKLSKNASHKSGKPNANMDCKSAEAYEQNTNDNQNKVKSPQLCEKGKPNSSEISTANLKRFQSSRIPKFYDQATSGSPKQDNAMDLKRTKSEGSCNMFDNESVRVAANKRNENPVKIEETKDQSTCELGNTVRKLNSSVRHDKDGKVPFEDQAKLSKVNMSQVKESSLPRHGKQRDDNNTKTSTSSSTDQATQKPELDRKEGIAEFTSKHSNDVDFDKRIGKSKTDKATINKERPSNQTERSKKNYVTACKVPRENESKLPQPNSNTFSCAKDNDGKSMFKKCYNEKTKVGEKVSTPKSMQTKCEENDFKITNASQNILRALEIIEDKLANKKTTSKTSETLIPKTKQRNGHFNSRSEFFETNNKTESSIEQAKLEHDIVYKKKLRDTSEPFRSKPLDASQKTNNCQIKINTSNRNQEIGKGAQKDITSSNEVKNFPNERQQSLDLEKKYYDKSKPRASFSIPSKAREQDALIKKEKHESKKIFEPDSLRNPQAATKLKNIEITKEGTLIDKAKACEEKHEINQKNSSGNLNKTNQNVNVVANESKTPKKLVRNSTPSTNPSTFKIKGKQIVDNDGKPATKAKINSPTASHNFPTTSHDFPTSHLKKKIESSSKSLKVAKNEPEKEVEYSGKCNAEISNDTLKLGKLRLKKILAYVPADLQAFKDLQKLYANKEECKESIPDVQANKINFTGEKANLKSTRGDVEDKRNQSCNRTESPPIKQKSSYQYFRQSSVDSKQKYELDATKFELEKQNTNAKLSRRHSAIPLRTDKQRPEVCDGGKNALQKSTAEEANSMKQKYKKEKETTHQEIRNVINKIQSQKPVIEVQKVSPPPPEALHANSIKISKTNDVQDRELKEKQLSEYITRKPFHGEITTFEEFRKQRTKLKNETSADKEFTYPQANDLACKREDSQLEKTQILYKRERKSKRRHAGKNVKVESEVNPEPSKEKLETNGQSEVVGEALFSPVSGLPFKFAKFSFVPIKQGNSENIDEGDITTKDMVQANAGMIKKKQFKDEITSQTKVPTFTKEMSRNTIKIQGTKIIQPNETVNDLTGKQKKIQFLLAELKKELLSYSSISNEENKPHIRELTDAISRLNANAKQKEMQYKIIKDRMQNKKAEAIIKTEKNENLWKNPIVNIYHGDDKKQDSNSRISECVDLPDASKISFKEAKFSFIPLKTIDYIDPDVPTKKKNEAQIIIQPAPEDPDPFPKNISPLLRYFLCKQLLKTKEAKAPKIDMECDENAEETLQHDLHITPRNNDNVSIIRSAESIYDRYPLLLKRKPIVPTTNPKHALEWKMKFIQQSQLKNNTNETDKYDNQSPLSKNSSQFTTSPRISTAKIPGTKNTTSRQFFTAIPTRKYLNPEIPMYDSEFIKDVSEKKLKRNPIKIKKANSNTHESVKVMFFDK